MAPIRKGRKVLKGREERKGGKELLLWFLWGKW
jgi:hypothetical protein